jgi:plastocyanin
LRSIFFILLALVAILAALFIAGDADGAASRYVAIRNFSYQPAHITVTKGTKVAWTNRDGVRHTATANNRAFNSGRLDPNERYTKTFKRAGKKPYFCMYHPHERGTIYVKR